MEIKNLFIIIYFFIMTSSTFCQDIVLAIHPKGDEFSQTIKSVQSNLGEDFIVKTFEIGTNASWNSIKGELDLSEIKSFLLLDNTSITIYQDYLGSLGDLKNPIPAIATMAIQLELVSQNLNIMGINYEIPLVTSIVNLRAVSSKTINKVGVIYRNSMKPFFNQNQSYCKSENIELVGIEIDYSSKYKLLKDIKKSIKHLLKEEQVDAIWVLNDNILLNKNTLKKGWITELNKSNLPVIVGVESLINTKLKFGNFAVTPDNIALGTQTAELIFELNENQWEIPQRRIDEPISVLKTINTTLAQKNDFLLKSGLTTIDKEVK